MKGVILLLLPVLLLRAEVYEIIEPDLLEEIEERASRLDVEVIAGRMKERIESFKGEDLVPAKKGRVYWVDPTYCLEEDIYYQEGGKWKVLYPKGYCFNPIDYIPYDPPPMVIFNPCRKEEREWVLKNVNIEKSLLVSSGCSIRDVRKSFPYSVYHLTSELKKKLRLKETVSVVSVDREKKKIRVEVVDVSGRGRGETSGEVSGEAQERRDKGESVD